MRSVHRRGALKVRLLIAALAGSVAALGAPQVAAADPNPDLTPARSFNLDCGTAGTFPVVFVESHLGTFHVTGDSTSIFQSTSLTIDGTLIFAEPGFNQNGTQELTCTFIGVVTGRHFTVTGFFTPSAKQRHDRRHRATRSSPRAA
jgi:hypothetical protein